MLNYYSHYQNYELAHNFGNASNNSTQVDVFPSLAVRVKNLLKIKNPKCVAYDILFGCPGWLEGMIQGYGFIKAGMAERCLDIFQPFQL